jgi:hypothetical protein
MSEATRSGPQTAGLTTPTPTISAVSTIHPQQTQTFTISGSGFGSQPPINGDLPCIEVSDLTKGWNAGHVDPASGPTESGAACSAPQGPNGDLITVQIAGWNDSTIVITGFSGAYGNIQNGWYLSAGDQVQVRVWNAQSGAGPASFKTTVAGTTTGTPSAIYLALGDSVASGHGLQDYVGPMACKRSPHGYPPAIAAALQRSAFIRPWDITRDFLACSGAPSGQIRSQADAAKAIIASVHSARGNDTGPDAYVSLDAGIDNFDFISSPTAFHLECESDSDFNKWVHANLATLDQDLLGSPRLSANSILGRIYGIGATGGPFKVKTVVHGYYDPLVDRVHPLVVAWHGIAPCNVGAGAALSLFRDIRAVARARVVLAELDAELNRLVATANAQLPAGAGRHPVQFVSIASRMGSNLSCTDPRSNVQNFKPQAFPWLNGSDCVHPSAFPFGVSVIANAVTNALEN